MRCTKHNQEYMVQFYLAAYYQCDCHPADDDRYIRIFSSDQEVLATTPRSVLGVCERCEQPKRVTSTLGPFSTEVCPTCDIERWSGK